MGSSNSRNVVVVKSHEVRSFTEEKPYKIIPKKPTQQQPEVKQNKQKQLESETHYISRADWVWPEGKIPYTIHDSVTIDMQNKLAKALIQFYKRTPIKFIEIVDLNQYSEFVEFRRSERNTSYTCWTGRRVKKGAHRVYLHENQKQGTYMHEIMHVLGFAHEHCRQDRDEYVLVQHQNLKTPNEEHQYEQKPKGYMIGKYDANSIMHYKESNNMLARVQSAQMGQRECLSDGDIKGINFVYGNLQCTYDALPEQYFVQPFYQCIDCWGEDTCYGVCELCAFMCHEGHKVNLVPLKEGSTFVCDCGRYQHKNGLCTRQSTKFKFVKQHMYLCFDCFDYQDMKQGDNLVGVCISCVSKCHSGHSVRYYGLENRFFCDCGLTKCKKKCNAQKCYYHKLIINGKLFLQEEIKTQKSSIKKVNSFLAQQIDEQNGKKKVTLKDFLSQGEIGRGKFGKVLRVKMKGKDNREYAMKVIKKADILKYGLVENTMLEKNVLGVSRNPFVVKLKYSFQTEQKLYLVMEFIKGGQLGKVLRKRPDKKFTEEQTQFCSAEIILGLEYMHNTLKVIYRDLKPENVMVTEEGHLKLADFGLSKQFENEETKFFTLAGTPEYLAPEILFNEGHNHMVDFWCLGILIYEMLVGQTPFYDDSDNHKIIEHKIKTGIVHYPEFVSEEAKDLINKLLIRDPQQRLGMKSNQEIRDHSFFQSINWKDLYELKIPSPILENTQVYPQGKKDYFGKKIYETPASHYIQTNGDFNGFSVMQE